MSEPVLQNGQSTPRQLTEAEFLALTDEERDAYIMSSDDDAEGEPWTEETLRAALQKGIDDFEAGRYRVLDRAAFEDIIASAKKESQEEEARNGQAR